MSSLTLAACGADEGSESASSTSGSGEDFSIVMVTDVGGVDDKSFNQSAWEGMEAWGEEHGLEKGPDGYNYKIGRAHV